MVHGLCLVKMISAALRVPDASLNSPAVFGNVSRPATGSAPITLIEKGQCRLNYKAIAAVHDETLWLICIDDVPDRAVLLQLKMVF